MRHRFRVGNLWSRLRRVFLLCVFLGMLGVPATGQGLEVVPVCDDDYLPQLEQLIDSASHSLDIVAYEFLSEGGEIRRITRRLVDRLKVNPALRVR
ncbi:MAG TPA: hypothetical protein PKO06_17420, partial [Candidatus Ozemobacteraceae bacterium]|nr:hypothetical protein [Candidatus Ozemobacteraceae bacterium]